MSDAKVMFETLGYDPAEPGQEVRFGFKCPIRKHRCEGALIHGRSGLKHDPQGQNGGAPHWHWNGNREAPTFTPSIDCKGCWHGYIRNGRCVDVNGNDEPERAL